MISRWSATLGCGAWSMTRPSRSSVACVRLRCRSKLTLTAWWSCWPAPSAISAYCRCRTTFTTPIRPGLPPRCLGMPRRDRWRIHHSCCCHTSGTTGDPKLITLSQNTKVLRAQQFAELFLITEDDVILVGTPLHFSMPQRLVFTALLRGATARLLPHYSPELWAEEAYRCSVVVGLPQQLPHLNGLVAPQLRLVLNSSAQRRDYTDSRYFDCYGTSEIAIATTVMAAMASHDNMGIAAPGIDIRIEFNGEIAVRTPLLFDGYFGRPDLTDAAMTADGYFLTGDSGFLDAESNLRLRGRLNDVIKVGGIKVYPEEVEATVAAMPGVLECAAVAVPDAKLGEHVHITIVMQPDTKPLGMRAIQHHCSRFLLSPSIPRSVAFVDKLPRTGTGKLLRRMIKHIP